MIPTQFVMQMFRCYSSWVTKNIIFGQISGRGEISSVVIMLVDSQFGLVNLEDSHLVEAQGTQLQSVIELVVLKKVLQLIIFTDCPSSVCCAYEAAAKILHDQLVFCGYHELSRLLMTMFWMMLRTSLQIVVNNTQLWCTLTVETTQRHFRDQSSQMQRYQMESHRVVTTANS